MTPIALTTDKPIIFFDLETTGTSMQDRIVEIGAIKIHVDQSVEQLHYLINPTVSIPVEASLIHGIYDHQLTDKPRFNEVASEIQTFFSGCDLGGYNIKRFDIPLIIEELLRSGMQGLDLRNTKIIDVCQLFHKREPRDLAAAVRFYTTGEHKAAHSAFGDIEATINVLTGQILMYSDLEADVSKLHNSLWGTDELLEPGGWFARGVDYKIYFLRGKHKGKCVEDEKGYLKWMQREGNDIMQASKQFIGLIEYEFRWREDFILWMKRSGKTVDILFLNSLHECIHNLESSGDITVLRNESNLSVSLWCGKNNSELLISSIDCRDYLLGYVNYFISEMK